MVLVASCSGKPNDLRHYGTQATETTTSSASPTTTTAPGSAGVKADPNALKVRARAALPTDQDVAEIGFHPVQAVAVQTMPCSMAMARVKDAQAGWIGATSATTLTAGVAASGGSLTGARTLATIKHALSCVSYEDGGRTYKVAPNASLPQPAGVDAFYAWCETSGAQWASCSALLAKGTLLARVQVVTTAEGKAKTLIGQVTAPAAAKLAARG
jgi:hypothetical protein